MNNVQHKTTKNLSTKNDKRQHKEFRQMRKTARGRQWQTT